MWVLLWTNNVMGYGGSKSSCTTPLFDDIYLIYDLFFNVYTQWASQLGHTECLC